MVLLRCLLIEFSRKPFVTWNTPQFIFIIVPSCKQIIYSLSSNFSVDCPHKTMGVQKINKKPTNKKPPSDRRYIVVFEWQTTHMFPRLMLSYMWLFAKAWSVFITYPQVLDTQTHTDIPPDTCLWPLVFAHVIWFVLHTNTQHYTTEQT